ncbi:FACT complex subunit spt16 [Asimina triloba]
MRFDQKYPSEINEYFNAKNNSTWATVVLAHFTKALSGLFNAERSTCTIDPHNFCKRLEGLYYYWKGCRNGVWSHFDVLTVAVPRVPDTKSSTFSIWLLGHEARGMIVLFSEKNIQLLCPEDQANPQANVLETVKDSVRKVVNAEMTIHVKKENSGGVELMDDVLDAIQIQPTHESLVAGYNTAEVPEVGYFCPWTEKLKKKFQIFDITDGLSEVFSVKDDIALANMKAASSLASSVMRDFVVPEIVHMFGDEVAPHSELANDMVEFIHDEEEAVGLNKENVRYAVADQCFRPDAVGLHCNGYWSNMSRTILIYHCIKQVLALRALIKAQKAAISVLKPGNKVSAAYQEAVSVVVREAPEFAPHLTESAGSGIDLELYDSRRLSLDASNERVLEVGMVFNVSLGFENLQVDTGNPLTEKFSMLIADTVVINEASTEALTDFTPCLISTEDDECLKVINISDYEAEYPKGQIHYVPSEDVWDDAVDSNNNCDNVVRLIQVDEKMEAVFLPFFGSVVPFHISCIRRVVGHSGERDDQYYLEVFFNTDDDKKMQLGPEAPSYLQKLMFYCMSPRGVREIGRGIKALQLKYALREARTRREKREVAGNAMLAQQDSENVRGENHPCKKRRLSLSRNNPSA